MTEPTIEEAAMMHARDPTPAPISFEFPTRVIERWVNLPSNHPVSAALTKQDLDNLLFGLLRSNDAQIALERTLVDWSNGRIDEANNRLTDFRRLNVESQNHVRQFFNSLMTSTLLEDRNV